MKRGEKSEKPYAKWLTVLDLDQSRPPLQPVNRVSRAREGRVIALQIEMVLCGA